MAKFDLRILANYEIEIFASRPKVKSKMVRLFLKSIFNFESAKTARQQLKKSAELCQWNDDTVKAIKDGIRTATI